MVNNTDNGGTTVAESYLIKGTVEEASGDKVGTATFTNKYTEDSNDGENKPLVVTKKVAGNQGNKGQGLQLHRHLHRSHRPSQGQDRCSGAERDHPQW